MSRETTYKGVLAELQQLNTTMVANASELSHLQGSRVRLEEVVNEATQVFSRQAALTASKQEASLALRTLLAEGKQLATILRLGIKHHYGKRSERVVEFGLQPFRGLKRTTTSTEPSPEVLPKASPVSDSASDSSTALDT